MTALRGKSTYSVALLCAASVVLSGCGMKWPEWATIDYDPLGGLSSSDRALAPEPPDFAPVKGPLHAYGDPVSTTKPLEVRPGGSMGSFGLNLETYIKEDDKGVEERLERLERTINAMHRDLKILVPAVQEMREPVQKPIPAIEHPMDDDAPVSLVPDMQDDVAYANDEIDSDGDAEMDDESAAEPKVEDGPKVALDALMAEKQKAPQAFAKDSIQDLPDAPASSAKTPVDQGPRPVAGVDGAVITGVRVGEHADKVRIVFDVTAKTGFDVDLDNGEKLLVVEMPNAGWQLPTLSENFAKFPVVKSYKVSPFNDGKGRIFVLQLRQATQVLLKQSFSALSGGGERIVIDLKK